MSRVTGRPSTPVAASCAAKRGDDAVEHGRLKREAHEPPAAAVGRELAAAVGLHARLLEQRAVGGVLALGDVPGRVSSRSRSEIHSLVCLAWKTSWIATP